MGKSFQKLSSVTRVGLDLAKRVFQVHAVDANGEIVAARKLARGRLVDFFSELPRFDPHSRPNQLPELPSPLNPRPTETYRKPSAFIVLIE
jgi:hypothetical protein